jgi:predicted acetyltransferase
MGKTRPVSTELRTPTEDDLDRMIDLDSEAFVWDMTAEERGAVRQMLTPHLDRFRIVVDGMGVVGVAGSYGLQLTVPGGRQVPTGGVTWVSVSATHRRRGLLRRLLDAVHDDVDERGEVVGALISSEGGIYERFGYGIASRRRVVEIDRRRAELRTESAPVGRVRRADPVAEADLLDEIWDRYRRGRVGEVDRPASWAPLRAVEARNRRAAVHDDGYVTWTKTAHWNDGHPAHELRIEELVAITPDAHAALWQLVLSTDLVGPVRSVSAVAVDDPLPYLLTDQRCVRTVELNDMLWVCPRRVRPLLEARTYGTDDALVIEVDLGEGGRRRWRVAGSPEAATARAARSRPDLVTDRAGLGALSLGGVAPSLLAAGGRLTARDAPTLRRADAFFTVNPPPHTITSF